MNSHSEIKVSPLNWEKKIISNLKKDWTIRYLYYCPEYPNGKPIRFKGMNHAKTLEEKQRLTRTLIDDELRNLENGYNPITGDFENVEILNERTPFIQALELASKKVHVAEPTLRGIKDAIKLISMSAKKNNLHTLQISEVRKRDMRVMLDSLIDMGYSNDRFNKVKTNIGILYNYFIDYEIFEHNYLHYIKKLPHTPEVKQVLTEEDKIKFDELKYSNYTLWRFMRMFYYAQCRIVELRELKIENVNLQNQTFTIFEKKGKRYHKVIKPINHNSLFLWEEIMSEVKKGDIYLFDNNYLPTGGDHCSKNSFNHKYNLWVSKKLGIKIEPYAFRHSFTNSIAENYGMDVAQRALGHTNQKTTRVYAVGQKNRDLDFQKNLDAAW